MNRSFLLAALLLAACAPAPAAAPAASTRASAPAQAAAQATVKAIGRVGLLDPGGRRLLDDPDLEPWQASDVGRVVLTVTKGGTTVNTPVILEGAAIGQSVELLPLSAGTTYTIVGRAYRLVDVAGEPTPEAIDAYEADPATCTTTFTTAARGDTVIPDPIRIQFGSRSFAGEGGNTLVVHDGEVTDDDPIPDINVDIIPD